MQALLPFEQFMSPIHQIELLRIYVRVKNDLVHVQKLIKPRLDLRLTLLQCENQVNIQMLTMFPLLYDKPKQRR